MTESNKTLKSSQRSYFLENVRDFDTYPVLHETNVEFFIEKGKPQLTYIRHPREILLSGILQIDRNSLFYFIPRNTKYDDMNPFFIPEDIEKML